ncbi:hypothetical protein QE363_000744 [Sphingomonas sp. SORGH_AS870]|uniref:phage tail protein n=1 Tax=Sphingomonas sp. SORGH_AS_0870 TaxID=3041801 RepID=UPI002857D247|nr:phage tail protein [Sphingomonas sp. SORGH_AS_0870]MDR6144951.1 hypothetical protein [Sphingomonas sp. SORGH_AS_0870]
MNKPASLSRLLIQAVPQFAENPENLALYVDEGRVAATSGASLSFEYRYKLNLVAQDFAGDRAALFVPLLAWIAQAQPDLLDRPTAEPFTFECELLDADTADISITLDLTERVAVRPREGGGYEVNYLDDPTPADLDRFDGVCGVNLWQLFLRDELIAQSDRPAPGASPGTS